MTSPKSWNEVPVSGLTGISREGAMVVRGILGEGRGWDILKPSDGFRRSEGRSYSKVFVACTEDAATVPRVLIRAGAIAGT